MLSVQTYSELFKRKMVQRLLLPDAPSANALSKEVGVPQSSLSRWLKTFGTVSSVSNDKKGSAAGPRGCAAGSRLFVGCLPSLE